MTVKGNGESYNSLTSSLIVSSRNKMEGTFIVYGVEDVDFPSSINPRVESYDDFDSLLNVPFQYTSDLVSVLRAPVYNKMEVIYDLEEPPVITSELSPIKDTFIRNFMPKVNFGTHGDLLVGSNSQGEVYRSLLQFDISSIPNNKIIKQAELVLSISSVNKKGDIQVSPVLQPWSEYGTTWDNQPPCGDYVSIGVNTDSSGSIRLDVTQLVVDWYEGNLTNNGIYLKALNELQKYYAAYFSREGAHPPKLVVKYYDPTVYSTGRSTLPSEVFIIGAGDSDLNSEVEIKALWHDADLDSSVYVNIPYELPIQLTVSRPSLPSSLVVTVNEDSNLSSEMTVRVEWSSDTESSVSIRGNRETDFDSSVFVKHIDQSDLESELLIVNYVNDLDSTIKVRNQYNNDFDSAVFIKYPGMSDVDSELTVHVTNNIDSTIKVRVLDDNDLDSTVTIHRKSDLDGEVMVYQKTELDSEMVVKYGDESNLNSQIYVYYKSDLDGILFVSSGQLRSELIVRGGGGSDLQSELFVVSVGDNDLGSQVVVRQQENNDLSSELAVRGFANFDLPSELFPRVIGVADIESTLEITVIVAYPYAYIM